MLPHFDELRNRLSDVMIKCIHKRILIYGYGYSGQFLNWYASYYHGIDVDYIISERRHQQLPPYEDGLFSDNLLRMNYKDVSNAIVWVALPMDEKLHNYLNEYGYVENITYFDFCKIIYGNDQFSGGGGNENPFKRRKSGRRDIQFMEWLEYKYECNIISAIYYKEMNQVNPQTGGHYSMTDQKDIFPIFDRAHIKPSDEDAIIDLGCGKGGPMISFLDYGFKKIGGIEFEKGIYDVLVDNIRKLNLDKNYEIECINADAQTVKNELDKYNFFFFFSPFYGEVFKKVCINLKESYYRRPRKMILILKYPNEQAHVENTGFVLVNQFLTNTSQRVISIYESNPKW